MLYEQDVHLFLIISERWGSLGLNQGPTGYESAALTTELLPHEWKKNHTQVRFIRQCKKIFGLYKPVSYRDVKGDPAWAAFL